MVRIIARLVVAAALVVTPFAAVVAVSGPAAGSGSTFQADPERCC